MRRRHHGVRAQAHQGRVFAQISQCGRRGGADPRLWLRRGHQCAAAVVPIRTLQNLAKNPNFGGEVLVVGLGCEKLVPERLIPDANSHEKGGTLRLQDEAFVGFGAMIDGILERVESRLKILTERKRETVPASELIVGMQCGGSDAFSGLTANPALGFCADLLVRAGATVMFSEVTEVRDAIHLLTPRAATKDVAQQLVQEMNWY